MENLIAKIPAPEFDLAKTLDSGQVFHWEKQGAGFLGAVGDVPVYVEQRANVLFATAESSEVYRFTRVSLQQLVENYFALDHSLPEICASFPNDPVMNAAREFCRGLRIIRQPKWECLATFICSSMKQVAHIRQISTKLRQRFGVSQRFDGNLVYTFPFAETLAETSERELRGCALGYRAKNLLATARRVASRDVDLETISILPDADLRARLCQLPGVGAKVANCVMLFAYERLRAFPIDVWIEQVLRQTYFPRARRLNAGRLRAFTERYFGDHGGYAQQYLFHHARMNNARIKTRGKSGRFVTLPRVK
jgi:N-glycosylase/DNA lyase